MAAAGVGSMSRLKRCWLLFLCALMLQPAPAHALTSDRQPAREEPSGWLELDAGPAGKVHRLTPGGTADWAVAVGVRGEPATALELRLEPGAGILRDYLSVTLRTCGQPWDEGGPAGSTCGAGEDTVLESTALREAEGTRLDLLGETSRAASGSPLPDTTYVLLTAALAVDAPKDVQGTRTSIVIGVFGSGDDPGGAAARKPGQAPSGSLADTGARLGGFLLLGVLAVVGGFAASRWRGGRG
ncbi:hypothetical protein ACPFL9_02800 [Paenarthrobacter sp. NyZ202]|uniref:hypothetical protein n=1 Tax=Paenarthrobacter sp. NyZ202 TaxID=3402689 RepID=UPI003CEC24AA